MDFQEFVTLNLSLFMLLLANRVADFKTLLAGEIYA